MFEKPHWILSFLEDSESLSCFLEWAFTQTSAAYIQHFHGTAPLASQEKGLGGIGRTAESTAGYVGAQ